MSQYTRYPAINGGGGGSVNSVTASGPLSSTGGSNPNISITGIISVAQGGTGLGTLTANNVILGNGTSSPTFVAPGTSGNVLTSNGTTWISSAAAASGANTALSNLITTSINQSLIPNVDVTRDLGTNALRWRDGYISNLKDSAGVISIAVENRYFADIGGTPVASYATGGRFGLQAGVTLDLAGSISGTVRLKAADTTTNHTLIYPAAQGAASTVLTNDGAGNLSWSPSSGSSSIPNKQTFVLSGTDITNQYIDLAQVALTNSITFLILGLQAAIEGASYDYSVSYTGGAGGKTRITFLNGIATGGVSALVATDVLQINYIY